MCCIVVSRSVTNHIFIKYHFTDMNYDEINHHMRVFAPCICLSLSLSRDVSVRLMCWWCLVLEEASKRVRRARIVVVVAAAWCPPTSKSCVVLAMFILE